MAQVLIRGLDEDLLSRLKQAAKSHHRSLQGEVKLILETHCQREQGMDRVRKELESLQAGFGQTVFSDTTDLIRADRDR